MIWHREHNNRIQPIAKIAIFLCIRYCSLLHKKLSLLATADANRYNAEGRLVKEYEISDKSMQSLNRHSLRVVVVGLILVGVIFGCVYSEGLTRQILVVVFYALTVVGYFIGTHFDAAVERATGPIRKLPKAVGLMVALAVSYVIHRWLFWG